MSLDVYLECEDTECPHCDGTGRVRNESYSSNITHNLGAMAKKAGIYMHLWRPEEIGVTKAGQLIEPLSTGIALMKGNPEMFLALNASNGWGTYDQFVPWIEEYLRACKDYPAATVRASR